MVAYLNVYQEEVVTSDTRQGSSILYIVDIREENLVIL